MRREREKESEKKTIFFFEKKATGARAFRSPSPPTEEHLPSPSDQMDLLRSIASSLAGGWSSRSRRGGSERGLFEGSSSSTSSTTMPSLPLQTALAPLQRQQQQTTPPPLSPARNSSSSIISSRNGTHHHHQHHQSPHRAVNASPPRPLLLRRRPSAALGFLDAGQMPPPPSAPLPPEQVERYWRLQRRLAATLLPEVVRLEALCAEIAAAAAAEATTEAARGAGAGSSSSPPPSASPPSGAPSSSSSSPRAGQDPRAATRIAALRRRTLVPLLARLRALPASEAGGGRGDATATSTSTPTTPSSSSSSPSPSNTTVPTRADLAALRRAAAVLPRYLEQLRVATRGRPRAFDSERFCAAAAA